MLGWVGLIDFATDPPPGYRSRGPLEIHQFFEKQERGGSTSSGFKNGKQWSDLGFVGFWD